MTDPETLDEYRAAFWLTFAEDHGLINEWSLSPQPERPEMRVKGRPIGWPLPGNSLGMIRSGS